MQQEIEVTISMEVNADLNKQQLRILIGDALQDFQVTNKIAIKEEKDIYKNY